jgi:hypothetical protein
VGAEILRVKALLTGRKRPGQGKKKVGGEVGQ